MNSITRGSIMNISVSPWLKYPEDNSHKQQCDAFQGSEKYLFLQLDDPCGKDVSLRFLRTQRSSENPEYVRS